ncbi:MAG TPA: PASTA domain-containing protein [Candidatus Sumerlaeota bacterium]|nr:PASTA domain-containing protein [Candidatus Sumerlaeota bacterium]HOR28926.1 PASTA domain-containing protein [Candidatus Sumerlaeota bacterium]HPK03970.1 PASTA domain-containing protein [Candidatus Sumerlaeota bacterium]
MAELAAAPSPRPPLPAARRSHWLLRLIRWIFRTIAEFIRFWLYIILFFAVIVLVSYQVVAHYIRGEEILAPDLTGLSVLEALRTMREDGLMLVLDGEQPHPTQREGQVISQIPAPGTRIKAGTPVRVLVSSGQALVTVPDLRGETKIPAGIRLRNLGLDVGTIAEIEEPGEPSGAILQTDPPGGTGVPEGTRVNLLVVKGRQSEFERVPNLLGMTLDQARIALSAQGLVLGEIREAPSDEVNVGEIHEQQPPPGETVLAQTSVSVTYVPSPSVEAEVEYYELPRVDLDFSEEEEPDRPAATPAVPLPEETPREPSMWRR